MPFRILAGLVLGFLALSVLGGLASSLISVVWQLVSLAIIGILAILLWHYPSE